MHLNSLSQEKYHRSLRGAILRSFSLFSTIWSCWIFSLHLISQSSPLKFTYLPRHAFVLVTAVYVTDLPPLFNWAHSILAALIVFTVLQNCCLPSVHNRLYFVSSWILWVCNPIRPPLFGCVLNALWYSFTKHLCHSILAIWLAIWFSAEFGYSSPLCVRSLATLPFVIKTKTNKQKTKLKGKIHIPSQTFN